LHIQKKEIEAATDYAMNTVEGDRKTSSADFEGDQSTKLGIGKEVDTSSQDIAAPEKTKDSDEAGMVRTPSQHDMNLVLKSLLRDNYSRR
jgi:hypothetical protein